MASKKREYLLDTAEKLFYTEGFHATGIDHIVNSAGVVRMTLYNNFASKDALVIEVLKRRHQRFLDKLDKTLRESAPGTATSNLIDIHGKWLAEEGNQGCIMVKAMGEFAEHNPEIFALARAAKLDLLDRIHTALDKDGISHVNGLDKRLFLILEGSNSALSIMNIEEVLAAKLQNVNAILNAKKEYDS